MIKHEILIQFTDDPSDIRNHGLGDYFYTHENKLIIKAFIKNNNFFNEAWLIALHELIEQRLTEHKGISEPEIDNYDRMIEEKGGNADEAGNEEDCPYRIAHRFAENIERLVAYELDIDWFNYYNNYQI